MGNIVGKVTYDDVLVDVCHDSMVFAFNGCGIAMYSRKTSKIVELEVFFVLATLISSMSMAVTLTAPCIAIAIPSTPVPQPMSRTVCPEKS